MENYKIELAVKNGTIDRLKSIMVDTEIRKRYSISEQIAMLRQQKSKPEEYAEFDSYAEECKAKIAKQIDDALTHVEAVPVLSQDVNPDDVDDSDFYEGDEDED